MLQVQRTAAPSRIADVLTQQREAAPPTSVKSTSQEMVRFLSRQGQVPEQGDEQSKLPVRP